ncbi:ComF family protein [Patescibacteria group bacterium]|nr:ComF family protein [Patescibacteria group bacterium]
MKMTEGWSVIKIKNFILDLLFPIECFGCGKEDIWLCKQCHKKIAFNIDQSCLKCGDANNFGEFCKNCKKDSFLDGVLVASFYKDEITKNLIKSLKYYFAKDIAKILGEFINLFLRNQLNKAWLIKQSKDIPQFFKDFNDALLIPVPLHPRRERWRGFNQSLKLAQEVIKHYQFELCDNKLKRIIHKKAQAKLQNSQREENINGCFEWQGQNLEGRNVIIIDDVVTTGSTLQEIARVLKENGSGEVWGLAVAKG